MPLPMNAYREAEALLDDYCRHAIPAHAQDKVRIGHYAKGMVFTLVEERPYYRDPSEWTRTDVARFRYNKTRGDWTLYWSDRNNKWHLYDRIEPTKDFSLLLQEVKKDPTRIFWG